MALTRKALAAMGIEPEKIDQIIEMHTDTVNGLKDDISKYKADADQLKTVQKERDDLKAELAKNGEEDWKSKYDKVQKDFDDYKKADKAKAELIKKTEAYKALLLEVGISAKRIDQILKVSAEEIAKVAFDDEGKVKDADKFKESIQKEWDGFIAKEGEKGADVSTPPSNNGGKLSREEIYKKDERGHYVLSTAERQKAIAENLSQK